MITVIYLGLVLLLLFKNYWIAALFIALLQAKIDDYFSCHTVGSNITVFINFYFAAFYYSYRSFQADKDFKKFNLLVNNYKFLLAFTWAILNLYSLIHHFKDAHWLNGTAFGLLFCNSYFSPHFQFFRSMYLNHHQGYLLITKMMSYGFIAGQFLMLPFLLFRKTRVLYYTFFLFYWIGITFIIDTSFLAHFALLLLLLLLPQFKINIKQILIQPNAFKLTKNAFKLNRTYAFVILMFALIHTPYLEKEVKKIVWLFREWDTYRLLEKKLAMVGLTKVNLFNTYQIEGGNKWFVIYKKDSNQWKMVPLIDTTGEKLNYYTDWLHTTNHGSDFLFLANTFQYAIGVERLDYYNSTTPYKMQGTVYERLARFDFNKYHIAPLETYSIRFYSNTKAKNSNNPFKATLDSTIYYHCNKTMLTRFQKTEGYPTNILE